MLRGPKFPVKKTRSWDRKPGHVPNFYPDPISLGPKQVALLDQYGRFPLPRVGCPLRPTPPRRPRPSAPALRFPPGMRRASAGGGAAEPRVRSPVRHAHAPCSRPRSRERMAGAVPGAIMDEDYFGSAAEWGDEADGGQVRGVPGAPDEDCWSPSPAGRPRPRRVVQAQPAPPPPAARPPPGRAASRGARDGDAGRGPGRPQ